MAGHLDHSPADVVRYLMIAHGVISLPSGISNPDWSGFVTTEPNIPDNVVTFYNTVGIKQGRSQPDGEIQELYGIQVRVRSSVPEEGYPKANEIAITLDQNVYQETVIIGTATYCVHSFMRTNNIRDIGKDAPTPTKRGIHVFDGVVIITQKILGTGTYF